MQQKLEAHQGPRFVSKMGSTVKTWAQPRLIFLELGCHHFPFPCCTRNTAWYTSVAFEKPTNQAKNIKRQARYQKIYFSSHNKMLHTYIVHQYTHTVHSQSHTQSYNNNSKNVCASVNCQAHTDTDLYSVFNSHSKQVLI